MSNCPISDAFSQSLLAGMFRDCLNNAENMRRIGNFDMARAELRAAIEKLNQLEALTPKSQPTISESKPIDL